MAATLRSPSPRSGPGGRWGGHRLNTHVSTTLRLPNSDATTPPAGDVTRGASPDPAPAFCSQATIAVVNTHAPPPDDQQERRARLLLAAETGSLRRRAPRPKVHCSLGREAVAIPDRCLAWNPVARGRALDGSSRRSRRRKQHSRRALRSRAAIADRTRSRLEAGFQGRVRRMRLSRGAGLRAAGARRCGPSFPLAAGARQPRADRPSAPVAW
jgi:hypothetical protein